jgi:hypothetical protein
MLSFGEILILFAIFKYNFMKIIFGECLALGEEGIFAESWPSWLSAKSPIFLILVDSEWPECGARSSASPRAGPCGSRRRVQFFLT